MAGPVKIEVAFQVQALPSGHLGPQERPHPIQVMIITLTFEWEFNF